MTPRATSSLLRTSQERESALMSVWCVYWLATQQLSSDDVIILKIDQLSSGSVMWWQQQGWLLAACYHWPATSTIKRESVLMSVWCVYWLATQQLSSDDVIILKIDQLSSGSVVCWQQQGWLLVACYHWLPCLPQLAAAL